VLFDWFTILAQIVNFLILLFLLRRFLYRPILNAMEAREQRIAALLEEAEQKRAEAEKEQLRFAAKNDEWQENRAKKQREMEQSIEQWRKEALQKARQDVDHSLNTWLSSVEDHKTDFLNDLHQFTVQKTYAIACRAVQDLAGTDLETQMIRTFLTNIQRQEVSLAQLANGSQAQDTALKIRSAFDLSDAMKDSLADKFQDHFHDRVTLKFETAPNLIAGIELVSESGYTAAWNLSRYLESLQTELDQQINAYLGERAPIPAQVESAANDD
jgi:F-type H+-transporting ATPase subunit b